MLGGRLGGLAWWLAWPAAACCPATAKSASAEKGEALLSGLTEDAIEVAGAAAEAVTPLKP